jgi:mRNA-degrading endonuclease RelE of RelBE toxin-antitoxin system
MKLGANSRNRIIDELREFEDFPKTKLDLIKIAGEEDTSRLRVGKHRALFKKNLYPLNLMMKRSLPVRL